ncbi:MAG: tRNA epoxyqueuosine(34) reductase QueG [Candidatus Competibacteraceae bacterium]|nr:tRNA epoxyqueuosine(34) reductase QueG [Candidatus Competibacteraceae bacterium]
MSLELTAFELTKLVVSIKRWGRALGFQRVGIADIDLKQPESRLLDWLAVEFHGEMAYMARHGVKRSRPAELIPGTARVITARMDYLPPASAEPWSVLRRPALGYVSRYALGRDYHKVLRQRLRQLAERIAAAIGPFGYRVFTDSAPVLEKALAEKAGLGWIGKHSNLLDRRAGSWFFLGEVYVDLLLPVDQPLTAHCGSCTACLDLCPTRAIVAPYQVDARRCISYHTIELHGPIPPEFRRAIGNRIYGCDDCQLVCPWNRFAQPSMEPDFHARLGLDAPDLLELWAWDEAEFLRRTEGSAIRRIGHQRWLRNIAVALGNAPYSALIVAALQARLADSSDLVREHILWALEQQSRRAREPR